MAQQDIAHTLDPALETLLCEHARVTEPEDAGFSLSVMAQCDGWQTGATPVPSDRRAMFIAAADWVSAGGFYVCGALVLLAGLLLAGAVSGGAAYLHGGTGPALWVASGLAAWSAWTLWERANT